MKPKTSLFQNSAKALAFASAVTFCVAGYSQAAELNWNTTTGDFNTAANWLVGAGPSTGLPGTSDNANIANGGTAQYTTNAAKTVLSLNPGLGGGGSVEVSGGNTFTATSGVAVGTQTGALTGTLTLSGASTVVSQSSGNTLVGASSSTVGAANAGSLGVLNVNAGATYTHVPGGADSLRIGDNTAGQTGTYKGTLNVNGGTFSVPTGRLYLGQSVGSIGEMTVSNGGVVSVPNGYIVVGREGQGKLTFSSGTISTGGTAFIVADRPAAIGSTGSVDHTGGNLLLNNTSELWIGTGVGSTGTYNLSGNAGITINNNWGVVGRDGATGTMNMSGGSIVKNGAGNFSTGNGGGIGTFNQTGGSVTVNGGDFYVGNDGAASTGIYNVSGASTTVVVNSWMAIGRANGTGTLSLSSGTITKTGNSTNGFTIGTGGGTNQGTVNITGGLLDIQSGPTYIGEDSQGTLNLSGSGEMRAPDVLVARTRAGLLNLGGGTLKTGSITGGTGTSEVDFNGTTIQATATQPLFFNNLSVADIKAGGAIIDTNGFNIGSNTFQAITGSGGLTKNGAGTLSLNGQNLFTGAIAVNAGKLVVATASFNPLGAVTVAASAGFGVNVQSSGDSVPVSSLTLGTSSTLDINVGAYGNSFTAPIVVSAPLNVAAATTGTIAINLSGSGLTSGHFPVVQYSGTALSAANFAKFKVGSLPLGVTVNATTPLINNTADKTIELNIIVKSPVWTGKISGAWDTTVKNWKNASDASDIAFADGDPVLFADVIPEADPSNPQLIAPTTTNVTLAGTVRPGAIVQFNNSAVTYTLAGAGKISNPTSGTVGLTKQGSGSLTIGTANDFTGVVRLEGGTLNVATLANGGVASPIGAGSSAVSSLVLAGGILNYTGTSSTTFNRGFTVGGADGGIGVNDAAANLTLAAPFTATAGGFAKKGAGTLTITTPGTNSLAVGGAITHIDGGKIVINGTGAATAQVINNGGDLWVGATTASAGQLDVTNTTLTVGGWLAIGRGNGDSGYISNMNVTGSTVTVANLSMGYANGLPNLATQNLNISGSTFNNTGNSAISENGGSTSNITATTGAVLNLNALNLALAGGSTANLTLSGNAIVNSRELQTGLGGNTSASTIIIGGTSAINVGIPTNTAYASFGRNGGTGTVTVKDSGTLTVTNDFTLGEANGSNGSGFLNIQDSAVVSTGGTTFIGRGTTNTGTINQTGGTYSNADLTDLQIGTAGTGIWNLSAGTVNCSGWTSVGHDGGSTGTLKVSGGTFNQTRADRGIVVGDGGTGTVNLSGSGIVNSAAGFRIGWSGTANGTVVQTGGTANIPANVILGNANSAQGTYNISAGTLNVSTGTGFNLIVGNADTSKGTLNVSGTGTIKLDNNASILLGNGNTNTNNTVTQTGGTITAFSDVGTTVGGTGSVVIGSAAATGTNTYNLTGGTLTVAKVTSAGSTSFFNFKGGTLKAAADSTTFVSGLTAASIEAGGANIDSNGHNVTITSALLDAGGGGGVTKTGTGTLTLAGVNTYLGNTAINAGSLALADNAVLRFYPTTNGVSNHLTGTGTATLDGDFNIDTTGAAAASGNSWTLVDNSVNKTYGATFSVIGFTGSSHVWTKVDGTKTWTFSEATGVLTLSVGTGTAYDTWTSTYFPGVTDPAIIGRNADPDHDGNSNALEFALGGVPNSGSDGPKVYAIQADSTADADTDKEQLLTIAVRSTVTPAFAGSPSPAANTSDGLTAYTIQGSLDLVGFTTVVTPVTPAITTGLPAAPAGYEYRTFSLNGSNGLAGKGFLRVKVN